MPPLEHPNTTSSPDGPEDVPQKAASPFAATTVGSVFGSLPHEGPTVSLEQMDAAITTEARRRAGA
jgi:hypothetical protein